MLKWTCANRCKTSLGPRSTFVSLWPQCGLRCTSVCLNRNICSLRARETSCGLALEVLRPRRCDSRCQLDIVVKDCMHVEPHVVLVKRHGIIAVVCIY